MAPTPLPARAPGRGPVEALMLFATVCWAGNIVAGKVALAAFPPLALAQLRMAAAATLFLAVFLVWRGPRHLRVRREQWPLLIAMALTGITANQLGYIGGLAKTSVTHAGLIQAIGPILVLLLSVALGAERLNAGKVAGMSVSFLGVALLLLARAPRGSGAHWSGDLLLLAAGGVFSYYTILTKRVADEYDPLVLNALVFALGAIFLVPFCAASVARVSWRHIPASAWWGLVFMALFGSFIAYLIYAFALEKLSASNAAAFAYLQPVIAALLGIWLLSERVGLDALIGGALILAGVYLTERQRGGHHHWRLLARGRV